MNDNQSRLLPYQTRWVKDRSRIKLMEKSRQIGLSWATAYACVRRTSQTITRQDTWVSSRDEIQARLFIEDCKIFAQALQIAANYRGMYLIDEEKRITAYVLEFANGKRIHSMSSNPDAQAGKRGTRVLDEFALHPDQRKLYGVAYPGITWGGQLEIISTHRGSNSLFNRLVEEVKHKGNPKKISLHRVTIMDALEQGFLERLKSKLPKGDPRLEMDRDAYLQFVRSGCPDEETWQQEYMCVPSDDSIAFLPYDMIASCEYKANELWETELEDAKHPLYVGVDIGREHDLTVIWLIEKIAGVAFTRRVICLEKTPFSKQEEILYALVALPQVRRVCIDRTGMGMQFAERAAERFGDYRIEGVTFSGPVKEDLAYPVRAAFEDKALRIPDDTFIRADLRAIKKETTAAGNIRFTADRGKNGHADRFWALALALHASKESAGSFRYETIMKKPESARASKLARRLVKL